MTENKAGSWLARFLTFLQVVLCDSGSTMSFTQITVYSDLSNLEVSEDNKERKAHIVPAAHNEYRLSLLRICGAISWDEFPPQCRFKESLETLLRSAASRLANV